MARSAFTGSNLPTLLNRKCALHGIYLGLSCVLWFASTTGGTALLYVSGFQPTLALATPTSIHAMHDIVIVETS